MTLEKLDRANDLVRRIKTLSRAYEDLKFIKDKDLTVGSIRIDHNAGSTGQMMFNSDGDLMNGVVDLLMSNTLTRIDKLEDEFKTI